MPEKRTLERANRDRREGKAPTTQAGEFIREEMEHIREGKHGARSSRQAIAIGLSKARRAGVNLPPPKRGAASSQTRRKAERDYARGHGAPARRRSGPKRAQASHAALEREGRAAASRKSLSAHARTAARRRSRSERVASAKKAAHTRATRRARSAH
jgi:hypothetical protein